MTQPAGNKSPWGGRFEKSPDEFLVEFGASLPVDKRMWREDIDGSIAHSAMLAAQGVISAKDADAIREGLLAIGKEIEAGEFVFDINDEDVHMAIERVLTERIGIAGARLHTGRSRNDQVATDTRLYTKRRVAEVATAVNGLRRALVEAAKAQTGVVMPGYTHLQKAQPVLLSHHLLAYTQMLSRDFERFVAAYKSADVSPLGCAALAGTTYPLDRTMTANQLGFSQVSTNSLDSVSDRDFLLDAVYACSACQMHLSRLSEELILWATDEFGFITLDDGYSTGSSIMPQKKNPDFAELIRGKSGRVFGDLMGLLTMLKGLPLAYNKDMQEDKEGVFDALDTVEDCLTAMAGMISTVRFNEDRMRFGAVGGFTAATDVADYLVGTGMPFRQAHEVVGELVLACEKQGLRLQDLTQADFVKVNPAFGEGIVEAVDIDRVVSRRNTVGGTAPTQVEAQLKITLEILDADENTLAEMH